MTKFLLIQCFYLHIDSYLYIGLFSESDLSYLYSEKISETSITERTGDNRYEGFFKSILLKKEISALIYLLKNEYTNYDLFIQIKELIYDQKNGIYIFEDYLVRYKEIKINKNVIITDKYFFLFDAIKINDNKFSITFWEPNNNKIYISLIQLYKIHDTNLYIKFYSINLNLYGYRIKQYMRSVYYNNFLGIMNVVNSDYLYFTLFSYINSTDSELIMNPNDRTMVNLGNYINTQNIENNIFGVALIGIKILKLPKSKDIGIYFVSSESGNIIFENQILSANDKIILVLDLESMVINNNIHTIEFAGILQQQDYLESNKYIIYSEFYGDESFENYYQKNIYLGRTSFYNFTFNNAIMGSSNDKSCCTYCKLCYSGKCIRCENEYKLIIKQNKCELDFDEEGYYYDEDSVSYRKCHNFCKTCNNGPKYYEELLEVEDTNCIECIPDYYKMENTNNCVNINNPPKYHYFNTTENKFLKCSENCLTCDESPINSTYYGCSSCDEISILYPQSTNCLNCVARNKYINYYFNECLDEIPEGFYLMDSSNKLIDICYESCKSCNTKGDENDHKCNECNEENPFNFQNKKCLNDCSEYDLYSDKQSKKCYTSCLVNEITTRVWGFNYECYESCPNGTKIDETKAGQNLCICERSYYTEGKKTICVDYDFETTELLQSTVITESPHSTIITESPQSTIITESPHSTIIKESPHSTIITESPQSTIITESPHSTFINKSPQSTIITESLEFSLINEL